METQLEQLDGDRVRLTVEVPAGEVHHAVEHATHDLAERVSSPASAPGKVPMPVLVSSGRQAAPLLRGGRVAHRQLVLERRRAARALRPVEQPDYEYELPTSDDEDWSFTAEFAVQPKPRAGRLDDARGAEARGRGSRRGRRRRSSRRCSARSPSSRPSRAARRSEGDVAVVDIVSEDGAASATTWSSSARERLVDEIEGGDHAALSSARADRGRLGARRRLDAAARPSR